MPLVVSHFTDVCSVKVSHMTDSVGPALYEDAKVKKMKFVTLKNLSFTLSECHSGI